ncbi:MAG TPA: hypothetical protein VIZ43_08575 [Trebonia sp.]
MHWLQFFLGFRNGDGNSAHYLFWSGAGSDISELAVVGAVLGGWHRLNCHVKGCPRIGRQRLDGTTWVVCRRHHPAGAPSHQDVIGAHEKAGKP